MERKDNSFLGHVAGLRAMAILFVVLFHMDGTTWTHGYLGVDVFLVITGFLLFRGAAQKRAHGGWRDVLGFLGKRISRLVPAMTLLIILTLAVGAFLLTPRDELFAARVGYAATLAKANVFLQVEQTNYFATDASFNPLLHLWYLSVALQVYFLWAAGRFALHRLPRGMQLSLLWLVGLASLAYAYSFSLHEWLSAMGLPVWNQSASPSYYAALPRLWEVLAGGVVFLLPDLQGSRRWASFAAVLGLALVLAPALVGAVPCLAGLEALPCTLLAVAGSVLLIRYAPHSLVAPLLENRLALWLGGISFSVYLVHMPVIIFGKLWAMDEMNAWYGAAFMALSLLLGQAYYLCVEKRRFAAWVVLLLWVAALLFSRSVRKTDAFIRYMPLPTIQSAGYDNWQVCEDDDLCANWDPAISSDLGSFCYFSRKPSQMKAPLMVVGDSESPASFVFMGDSHAQSLYAGLHEALRREKGLSGVYLDSIVFPCAGYSYYLNAHYFSTPDKHAAIFRWLAAHPRLSHVIIAQYWLARAHGVPGFEEKLRDFLKELQAAGKRVVLLGGLPVYPENNPLRYQRILSLKGIALQDIVPRITQEAYAVQKKKYMGILLRLQEEGLCTVIDLQDALQPGEAFLGSQGGKPYIADTHHPSPEGAIWLMQRLRRQLRAALTSGNK